MNDTTDLDSSNEDTDEENDLETIQNIGTELEEFDTELKEVIKHYEELDFTKTIKKSKQTNKQTLEQIDFDELAEYDFSRLNTNTTNELNNKPIKDLSINLGTDEIPRYSCACHKNNIAVRIAIKKHNHISRVLVKLSKYAAKHKNSINLVKLSIKKKARLRIENKTRWSSSYLMLESFHRAYLRNAFPSESPCPVSFEDIELYLQILLPAFKFNLIMQKTKSTIGDILPTLNIMLSKWNRMEVTGKYKDLCNNLILAFQHKFKFELKSEIYAVAALFNVSKLDMWYKRKDCTEMRTRAIDNIVNTAISFLNNKTTHADAQENLEQTISTSSSVDSLIGMMRDDDYLSENEVNSEVTSMTILKEKIEFLKMVESPNFKPKSTAQFWTKNSERFNMLTYVATILYNIPSSSAYIERFYSICGNVCKQRSGNMSSQTIINRSILKANIEILEKLTEK